MLDSRTIHEHRLLDGQRVAVGKKFKVSGDEIEYPGDPSAPGYLIYNCRCTLVPAIKGYDQSNAPRDSRLGDMSYEEWKHELEHDKRGIFDIFKSSEYLSLNDIKNSNIDYLPITKLNTPISHNAIISRIGGLDDTAGSCSSLAFAYVANRNGYSVYDFRGGDSC